MANVYANVALDMYDLNLNDLIADQFSADFYDNVNQTYHGRTYQDVLRVGFYGDIATYAFFGGIGITLNPSTGAVTGGTVTGYLQQSYGGADLWGVEGFSYSALSMYYAATTPGTGDDYAIFASILSGADTFNLSGQADRADGYAGNDALNGNAGNDTLYGGSGSDTLAGGTGNDLLVGCTGNDIYQVDSVGDTIVETSTATTEIDRVYSLVSRTLGANVEQLALLGGAGLSGYGNGLANTIWGNGGTNRLSGADGNDTLYGGAGGDILVGGSGSDAMVGGLGNDLYYVDATGDVVVETSTSATEIDRVYTLVSRVLDTNAEQLVLQGSANLNGYGNGLANTVWGNGGANRLSGGAGNDTLYGGAGNDLVAGGTGSDVMVGGLGNDVYFVDAAGDVVIETSTSATEIDRVYTLVSRSLGANLEQLVLQGSANLNGVGNGLANAILGNGGSNLLSGGDGRDALSGGAGNDILVGGLGSDLLTGGAGADRFVFTAGLSASTNVDRMADFAHVDDAIGLDNAVFTTIGPLGALSASAFRIGSAAADASDRVIYNPATGALSYDADGTGATAAVLFAVVTAHTTVDVTDFYVI